ncbi:MAG: hypothetical protein ED558_17160 [Oricola sp.]|jgi:hypothetical protein|nr:MAG: hypothetical protein ED558_17160 [Oricola sp.]
MMENAVAEKTNSRKSIRHVLLTPGLAQQLSRQQLLRGMKLLGMPVDDASTRDDILRVLEQGPDEAGRTSAGAN